MKTVYPRLLTSTLCTPPKEYTPCLSTLPTPLLEAVAAVSGQNLTASLSEVARLLPVPTSSEVVTIRLRSTDGDGLFHVVALEGAPPRERRSRALNPISFTVAKSIAALGGQHTLAQTLGLRWLHSGWIPGPDGPAGVAFLGSRTERQLTEAGRQLFAEICPLLGERLTSVDRSESTLLEASLRIAREAVLAPEWPGGALDALRPRERVIVTQYAEGLTVDEIAQLLVISPHTVRTHVKNAFRRLGVHSRDEAARLLFAEEVRRLL
jgi:DNA-binding CsgD family transcriptional regulator